MFQFLLISTLLFAGSLSLDFDCPADGQHFYRYPYDCSKFIECNDGMYKVTDCIPGLIFDERISYCDFPNNVACVVEDIPVNCPPVNGEFATFLAHETDCTKYYECDWGKPILMDCPKGLYFNDKLDVCDYPKDSGCTPKD